MACRWQCQVQHSNAWPARLDRPTPSRYWHRKQTSHVFSSSWNVRRHTRSSFIANHSRTEQNPKSPKPHGSRPKFCLVLGRECGNGLWRLLLGIKEGLRKGSIPRALGGASAPDPPVRLTANPAVGGRKRPPRQETPFLQGSL